MQNTPEQFYLARSKQLENELIDLNKKINIVSILRLVSFLLFFAALALLTLISIKIIAYVGIFITILAFFFLVKHHLKLSNLKVYTESLLIINKNELLYLNHNFSGFYDGKEFEDSTHPYSSDLNLFGHASLFQYLNRTITSFGRDKLVKAFVNPELEREEILKNQQSCKELAEKIIWRQAFQAKGKNDDKKNIEIENVMKWLSEPNIFLSKKKLQFTLKFLPFVSISLLIFGFITEIYAFAELAFAIQISLVLKYTRIINKIHEKLSQSFEVLQSYSELMKLIENETFQSEKLKAAQEILCKTNGSASVQLKKLSNILQLFDRRLNILAAFTLNGLYMADLKAVSQLEQWKLNNSDKLNNWFEALGDFDWTSSIACLAYNNGQYCYPELTENTIIEGLEIGHPLIPENKRVANNFSIPAKGCFVILTGANMAGKSTFLRTVGINMLLGMTGAPVCAKEFRFWPLPIMTSISVKDSLFDNESYFYAELKRLKMIIDELNKGKQVFILLDEILKGTNSNDKLSGSKSLLQKLANFHTSGIVATHDIALSELESHFPESIKNHSFEVELDGDRLYYDYKLCDGVCKNLNASYLMKKMGITE